MKDKIDAIYEKCAGTMPKNCTTFWRTADECFHKELDKAETGPQLSGSKRQTLQSIDQCYQRTPNDPFADLFEELYPEMLLFDDGGAKPQQQIGFGGRKFLPPPQCAPTVENLQCVSKEMTALAQDPDARKASAALRRLKRGCSEKLSSECTPQSPPLWLCVDRAMKRFTQQTEEAMQKCMQQKGFTLLLRPASLGPGVGPGVPPPIGLPSNGAAGPQFAPASGIMGNVPPAAGGGLQGQQRMFDWFFE